MNPIPLPPVFGKIATKMLPFRGEAILFHVGDFEFLPDLPENGMDLERFLVEWKAFLVEVIVLLLKGNLFFEKQKCFQAG